MTQHANLANSELHEPKGVASASKGTAYRADGSGSGVWVRPMDLVQSGDNESGTELEISGLSPYSELYLILEACSMNTSEAFFIAELYSTSGAAYRTSGYLNSYNSEVEDKDETDTGVNGIMLARRFASTQHQTGICHFTNFNSSTRKTVCTSQSASVNALYPSTTTIPDKQRGLVSTGLYDTAEAHEKIKMKPSSGSFSSLYYTLWGIRT